MIIDFHSHVKISKKSSFSPTYFKEMMKEAKENGLTALAMTEHFNTTRLFEVYDFLDEHYQYIDHYYDVDGLKLFPGIEVDVKEGGHILLIGERRVIKKIRGQLDPHIEDENFLAYEQLMKLIAPYELLKIGAHPFRASTPLARNVWRESLRQLDAFDLNGKDLYAKGIESCEQELRILANELNIPVIGGSDTHQFLQYGSIVNKMEKECSTIDELKQEIKAGNFEIVIHPALYLKVKSASLVKKFMKKYLESKSVTILR